MTAEQLMELIRGQPAEVQDQLWRLVVPAPAAPPVVAAPAPVVPQVAPDHGNPRRNLAKAYKKPQDFDGSAKWRLLQSETWLKQTVDYILISTEGNPEWDQVNVIGQYLVNDAWTWWSYYYDEHTRRTRIRTIEEFKHLFRLRWVPEEEKRRVRDQLRVYVQGNKSVFTYVNGYQNLVEQLPELSMSEQINGFIWGLRDIDLKKRLACQRFHDLHDVITEVRKYDAIDHSARMQERFLRTGFRSNTGGGTVSGGGSGGNMTHGGVGAAPMELGALDGDDDPLDFTPTDELNQLGARQQSARSVPYWAAKHGVKTSEELTRILQEKRCLRCRQTGHQVRDCPMMGKAPSQ